MLCNGWLNLYKPCGISSAKLVSIVKKAFPKIKVGHCGTLDVEAEGVLPLAIGEATKLVRVLMNATKAYIFIVQFGAKTDTADSSGVVIETTNCLPTKEQCYNICSKFIGAITQIPPRFSALKVNGVRAYKLARENKSFNLQPRIIDIFNLKCLAFDSINNTATYSVVCSKGTYVRSIAEDIALSLQSLGFVIELRRIQVGKFVIENSLSLEEFENIQQPSLQCFLKTRCMNIETVLDDIPALNATHKQAREIVQGISCIFDIDNVDFCYVTYNNVLLAIGSVNNNRFKSFRVFNLIKIGGVDVDYS